MGCLDPKAIQKRIFSRDLAVTLTVFVIELQKLIEVYHLRT